MNLQEQIEALEKATKDINDKIVLLKEQMSVEAKAEPWKPKDSAIAGFYIQEDGTISCTTPDTACVIYGNNFATEELARKARNMARRLFWEFQLAYELQGEFSPDWSNEKTVAFSIYKDGISNEYLIHEMSSEEDINQVMYKDDAIAEQAAKIMTTWDLNGIEEFENIARRHRP